MEIHTVIARDSFDKTQTQLMPLVFQEFLPEKDISNGNALRGDYEKLRIVYELQKDIASEIKNQCRLEPDLGPDRRNPPL